MYDIHYKYFSSFLSFIIHSLLIFSFYYIALYSPQKSNGLIEFGIESGGGNSLTIDKQDHVEAIKSAEENLIRADTKNKAQPKEKLQAATSNNKKSGTGTGTGDGIGSGDASGVSLGLTPPPKPKEEEIYLVAVDEMPEPIGGIQKIVSQTIYPVEAKRQGINGTVFVLAYVDENGTVRKTLLTKGIGGGCDEAALRAVSFSRFKPGKHKGRYVKVQVQIPVPFNLN